jgi:uncharacterized repeat protein (TIGR01451 family)
MKRSLRLLLALSLAACGTAAAQPFTEAFDAGVPGTWLQTNRSNPAGTTGWFAGNSGIFLSQAGAAGAYVAANFNNTTDNGTISDWLITPQLTNLQNGEILSFYTRTEAGSTYPDRLEVRLCVGNTAACSDVGTTEASVGNFTTLLLTVNQALSSGGYPATAWTQYTATLTGLPAGASQGRVGFRYFVPNAGPGPLAVNSDYIGIDSLALTGPPVDLAITKSVDIPSPQFLGAVVTFTLSVTNSGTNPATNVTVNDLLPAGLQFLSATASQGSYNSVTGVWTVGSVDNTAPRTLLVRAGVTATGTFTNTATVVSADDPDPTPGNNTASVSVTASGSSVPTLNEFGLIAFGLFLGLGGFIVLRRSS